ncbi:hypothetical protein [Scytonema sp. NUACC26]|uniref:Acb2/Tad1 domain-containing protein n=1 Tax=Scytonema sp. NUACC26 TaxID=3140176 RepID=UPI0038B2F47A
MKLPIEEYFKYHPPKTDDRIKKHNIINDAALRFARVIEENCKDEECRKMAIVALQQAKMFANQGAMVDELVDM